MALASEVGRPLGLLYSTAEKPSVLPVGSTDGARLDTPEALRAGTSPPAKQVPANTEAITNISVRHKRSLTLRFLCALMTGIRLLFSCALRGMDPVHIDRSPVGTLHTEFIISYVSLNFLSKFGKNKKNRAVFQPPREREYSIRSVSTISLSAEKQASFRCLRPIEEAGLDPSAHEPNTQLSQGPVRRLPGNHRM